MNKKPFLEFLKQYPENPIIVPKTDSGKYAIHFTNLYYFDPAQKEWIGFMVYATNFAEAMMMLEEIYYNHEIQIKN